MTDMEIAQEPGKLHSKLDAIAPTSRRETTISSDFLTDATEIALAAFDDAYTGEYVATGSTDNKTVAMREAVNSIVALCAMEAEWKPGDPRCDQCDNGILATWTACPYCGHRRNKHPRETLAIIGDEFIIRVPVEALAIAAPLAWGKRSGKPLTVTDVVTFANEILRELKKETETGETLLTDMFDAAVVRAVEYGAEGAEIAVES